ncbi:MAG: cobyric acid synthase [Syntrophomonadaceae bacterium]
MVQGTGSHVGKSVLVAALCRIFRQDGYMVAPFKAQNMALNSFVTTDGGEMGRAQVVQAQAAGIEPHVDMNPVLLKPAADNASQVIVHGRPVGMFGARHYHNDYVQQVWPAILESFARLAQKYQIIVLEGAGSPAEVNLQKNDVVNMRAAHMAQAPVILVADIDKGGALAAVVGTLELLPPEDKKMVAGIVINKFRGDQELLQPALDFLEARTALPVLGVIPYLDFAVPEEDTLNDELHPALSGAKVLEIGVLYLPHISNFTDFDPLEGEPDVHLRYIKPGHRWGKLDCLIIPGSKNTIGDLHWIRGLGWEQEILDQVNSGVPVIGICGGFQMLGTKIIDAGGVESLCPNTPGLGILGITTYFRDEKITWQVRGKGLGCARWIGDGSNTEVTGYEIHMGQSLRSPGVAPAFQIYRDHEPGIEVLDGAVSHDGLVWGTYLHGLFEADGFRRAFLNQLRRTKGLAPLEPQYNFHQSRQAAYDRLADVVRANLDIGKVCEIMGLGGGR